MTPQVFDAEDLADSVSAGFLKGVAWALNRQGQRFSVDDVRAASEAFGSEFAKGVMAEIAS